jgi:hypothetical protein
MRKSIITSFIFSAILIIGGCSSTPTWEGMSQDDITAWKALGLDAAASQDWSAAGLTPTQAGAWIAANIDVKTASKWVGEQFTATEATEWTQGGFDLKQAIKSRSDGLRPVN